MRHARVTYWVIAGGALAWCTAIILAPLLLAGPPPFRTFGELVYSVFAPVCHQFEARSLTLSGEPMGVCARCTAIYFAFLAGTILYPVLRTIDRPVFPPRLLLAAALLPMVLDAVPGMIGIHAVTFTTRIVTGVAAGAVLPFFIIPAAIEAISELLPSRTLLHHQKGTTDA